jgi:hypothetical protein
MVAELEHLAKHRHSARCACFAGNHLERPPQCRRARIVRIVHQHDMVAETPYGAAPIRSREMRRGARDVLEVNAKVDRHGGGRQHVGEVAAAE